MTRPAGMSAGEFMRVHGSWHDHERRAIPPEPVPEVGQVREVTESQNRWFGVNGSDTVGEWRDVQYTRRERWIGSCWAACGAPAAPDPVTG